MAVTDPSQINPAIPGVVVRRKKLPTRPNENDEDEVLTLDLNDITFRTQLQEGPTGEGRTNTDGQAPTSFSNTAQSATANCDGASDCGISTGSNTVTVAAGTYTSSESVAAANALALAAATTMAEAGLTCTITQVRETFDSYTVGSVNASLNACSAYWGAAWVIENQETGIQAFDDMEAYTAGTVSSTLQEGFINWANNSSYPWVFETQPTGLASRDDMEEYTVGTISTSLSGGDGNWVGSAYVIEDQENGLLSEESWDDYSVGAAGTLNGGIGWSGAWSIETIS